MVFLNVEEFDESHGKTRRIIFLSCFGFVALVSALIIILTASGSRRKPVRNQKIDIYLQLKLSPKDIRGFWGSIHSPQWVNVTAMESREKVYRAKLGHLKGSSTDLRVEVNDVIYNLFLLDDKRADIYNFFKLAGLWGIESSPTRVVEIKINGVVIGNYIMERQLYELIRERDHSFLISLGANTYRLRKILYFARNGDFSLLEKYFDLDRLASYLVYFSLYSLTEPLDFGRMVFKYTPPRNMFFPYITFNSVLNALEQDGKEFKNLDEYNFLAYRGLEHKNIKHLLDQTTNDKYRYLIKFVMLHATKKLQREK